MDRRVKIRARRGSWRRAVASHSSSEFFLSPYRLLSVSSLHPPHVSPSYDLTLPLRSILNCLPLRVSSRSHFLLFPPARLFFVGKPNQSRSQETLTLTNEYNSPLPSPGFAPSRLSVCQFTRIPSSRRARSSSRAIVTSRRLIRLPQPLLRIRVEQPSSGDELRLGVENKPEPWLVRDVDAAACKRAKNKRRRRNDDQRGGETRKKRRQEGVKWEGEGEERGEGGRGEERRLEGEQREGDEPIGIGSFKNRSPNTGWMLLPSGELAMYSQKGEWGCEMIKW